MAATAAALTDGELSPAHAQVLAAGTRDLPTQVTAEAEPVLVEAARRLDPPRLRRVLGHLVQVADHGGGGEHEPAAAAPGGELGLAARLGAAMALLPPILGGAPSQPLDVGRTTRVVQTAQRTALAVRDGGCVFPGCARPLAWSAAHHLWHWLDGGPTDLANLVLLCRAHHRAVHEGGWRLTRQPDGRLTATPPHRRHPAARRHPSAA